MAKKTIPVNNYNDSDNYGTSGAAPSLYSDKHYLDGDGFLYGLGMASQRMIVKGKTTDIDTSCFFWNGGGTNAKLELNMPSIASYLAGKGFYASAGKLNLMFYTKRNGNINESGLIVPEDSDSHVSGLKINYGPGLMLNSNGQLVVDSAAVVPNISGTNPIEVTTSGNNKSVGLKLLAGTHQGDISGMRVVEAGTVESGDTLLGGLAVNVQSPLTITDTGSSGSAVVLNGSEFIDWLGHGGSDFGLDNTLSYYTSDGRHVLGFNRSTIGQGLKVVTESGQQYRIDVMPGDYTEIKTMGDSGNQYTAVDVDIPALFAQVTRDKSIYGIGITPNSDASHSNNLYIDGSVLAGDGLQGTGYSDSDSTITPKLKLKIANGSPLYINSTNKALDLRIGDGLIVTNTSTAPTLQFAMGSGFVKSGESIDVDAYNGITVDSNGVSVHPKSNSGIGVDSNGVYLKAATTSEIGGVKTGTPATISGTNTVDIPLFLDSNNVGWVRTNIFTQKAPASGSAGEFPYSASYIDTNYSTKTEVTAEIASAVSDISGREYKIFTDWPAPPTNPTKEQWDEFYATYKKYIALKSTGGTDPDAYEERILIRTNESTGECRWEKIGDTKFTTDNFVAKTDVLTQAEVASIVQDVFGF